MTDPTLGGGAETLRSAVRTDLAGRRADALAREARGLAARSGADGEPVDLDEAGSRLEALFGQLLAREMRRGLGEGFFGKGPGADTFEGWFDEHLGRQLAEAGALDMAGYLRRATGPRYETMDLESARAAYAEAMGREPEAGDREEATR